MTYKLCWTLDTKLLATLGTSMVALTGNAATDAANQRGAIQVVVLQLDDWHSAKCDPIPSPWAMAFTACALLHMWHALPHGRAHDTPAPPGCPTTHTTTAQPQHIYGFLQTAQHSLAHVVHLPACLVDLNILQHSTKSDSLVDLRLTGCLQPNALGIAAALNVEHTCSARSTAGGGDTRADHC